MTYFQRTSTQEIVLEGRESSDCLFVATRIDADGRDSGDWRFVTTRIDAVKRSPTSADTTDCVRVEFYLYPTVGRPLQS